MQQQGQQFGWGGQQGGPRPPPPPGPGPPPPRSSNGNSNINQNHQASGGGGLGNFTPQVSLQLHHWQQQQQHQPTGPIFFPAQMQSMQNMGMMALPQQAMFMQPIMMQQSHFQQYQSGNGNGDGNIGGVGRGGTGAGQRRYGNNQGQGQGQSQPPRPPPPDSSHQQGMGIKPRSGIDDSRPSLSLPPSKRQRKKDIVPPLEVVTAEPVVRAPLNETERKEVEAWKAERRKNWPSADNVLKKEQEAAARAARGELDPSNDTRRSRLHEILHRQRAMGLNKQAGTEDLLQEISRGGRGGGAGGSGRGDRGRGRAGGRGGRGSGNSNGPWQGSSNSGPRGGVHGWERFMEAGEAPKIDPGLERWKQRQQQGKTQGDIEIGKPQQQQQEQQVEDRNRAGDESSAREIEIDDRGKGLMEERKTEDSAIVLLEQGKDSSGQLQGLDALLGYDSDEEKPPKALVTENTSRVPIDEINPTAVPSGDKPAGEKKKVEFQIDAGAGEKRRDFRGGGGGERGRGRGKGRGDRGRGRSGADARPGGRGRGVVHQRHQVPARPQPPSLLEKLLAAEIRQDLSYILQSFRFFVANEFFEGYARGEPLQFPAAMPETSQEAAAVVVVKPTIQDILGKSTN